MKQIKIYRCLLLDYDNVTHSDSPVFYLVTTKELLVAIFEVLHLVQFAALLAIAHHDVLLVVDAPHYPQDPVSAWSRPGPAVTRAPWPVPGPAPPCLHVPKNPTYLIQLSLSY